MAPIDSNSECGPRLHKISTLKSLKSLKIFKVVNILKLINFLNYISCVNSIINITFIKSLSFHLEKSMVRLVRLTDRPY